jgi:hypothetical protein
LLIIGVFEERFDGIGISPIGATTPSAAREVSFWRVDPLAVTGQVESRKTKARAETAQQRSMITVEQIGLAICHVRKHHIVYPDPMRLRWHRYSG